MKQQKHPRQKKTQTRTRRERLVRFGREVRAELKRVSWPSRKQVVNSTVVTLITVTVLTLFIFGLDSAFGWLILNAFV